MSTRDELLALALMLESNDEIPLAVRDDHVATLRRAADELPTELELAEFEEAAASERALARGLEPWGKLADVALNELPLATARLTLRALTVAAGLAAEIAGGPLAGGITRAVADDVGRMVEQKLGGAR